MRWSKDQDLIQLMEILLFELYSQNTYSPECERVWEQIAENLNSQREDKILFKITQRSVRDRFHVLKTTLPSEKEMKNLLVVFHQKFLNLMSVWGS